MNESTTTRVLQRLLDRIQAGDPSARDELIAHAYDRLLTLTRRMLRRYSRLRSWEQSQDIAHESMLRLRRALEGTQPTSVREFLGLASVQIRRELIDLTRHYFGSHRDAAADVEDAKRAHPRSPKAFSQLGHSDEAKSDPASQAAGSDTLDPAILAAWKEFHEAVQRLPEVQREVFELLWYQGLTQEEVAELLGVDKSTVKRRWRAARRTLADSLEGWLPGLEAAAKDDPPDD